MGLCLRCLRSEQVEITLFACIASTWMKERFLGRGKIRCRKALFLDLTLRAGLPIGSRETASASHDAEDTPDLLTVACFQAAPLRRGGWRVEPDYVKLPRGRA